MGPEGAGGGKVFWGRGMFAWLIPVKDVFDVPKSRTQVPSFSQLILAF